MFANGPTCSTVSRVFLLDEKRLAGLLNKICPENVDSIIEKIAAIKVEDIKELEVQRNSRSDIFQYLKKSNTTPFLVIPCGL